jgi:GTPase SAR1 family protein
MVVLLWGKHRMCTVLLLGMDDTGKTTRRNAIMGDRLFPHGPTLYPQCLQTPHDNAANGGYDSRGRHGLDLQLWDMGGIAACRKLWRDYLGGVDGVISIVDAPDPDRSRHSLMHNPNPSPNPSP